MDFWAYGLRKTRLDKYLKSPVLEDTTLKAIQLEKVSLSYVQNLRVFC